MPGFFDRLFNRQNERRNNSSNSSTCPAANQPATAAPADTSRDALRNMNYADGRNSVRPQPGGPAATPTPEAPASTGVQSVPLPEGTHYTVTSGDVQYNDGATWTHIAEQHGMIAWRLKQANEGIEQPAEGIELYIPSSEELLYADCVKKAGDEDKAAAMYAEVAQSGGLAIVSGARNSASGDMGESYGTSGKDGAFWASNPELAGASSRRTATHNGEQKYKVIWASNFWKCNLFANESVYQAGYEGSMRENKHYTTAGALHQDTKTYSQVPAASAYAGCVVQLFGGTGSDASHSGVCGSMPIITTDESGDTVVDFTFIGASTDRAKEQDKRITLKKGTDVIVSGDSHKNLRFLKALKKR